MPKGKKKKKKFRDRNKTKQTGNFVCSFVLFFRYFCRSIEYDDRRRECIISEEDSVSQRDDLRSSSSPSRHLFDLVCLDNRTLLLLLLLSLSYLVCIIVCLIFVCTCLI